MNSYNEIIDIADIAGMNVGCAGDFPYLKIWKP
jgi:hypothetical protein